MKRVLAVFAALDVTLLSSALLAAESPKVGPQPWQLGLQPSASPTMDFIVSFHDWLVILITGISVFVLALLLFVAYRVQRVKKSNAIENNASFSSRSGVDRYTNINFSCYSHPVLQIALLRRPCRKS